MATPTLNPKVRFKTPAVCHKSFAAPPDIPKGFLPPTLFGFASWRDPDPLAPADFSSVVNLRLLNPAGFYAGTGPGPIDFFTVRLLLNIPLQLWSAFLTLHGQRVPPETFIFPAFAIDPTKDFDTGLLTEHPALPIELRQMRLAY